MTIASTVHPTESGDQILPLKVNWVEGFNDIYNFKTDLIVSHTGKEQRRAIRDRPRRSVEMQVTFDNRKLYFLNMHMSRNQHSRTLIPDITKPLITQNVLRASYLDINDDFVAGDIVCPCQGDGYWPTPGQTVLLINGETIESRTLSAAATNGEVTTLVFVENDGKVEFPEGTRIFPALVGRPESSDFEANRVISTVATTQLSFQVEPGSETYDQGTQYERVNGRELFEKRHNYSGLKELSYDQNREILDFGFGRMNYYTPHRHPSRTMSISVLASSTAEVNEVISFFHRMRGRLGEFFMPTWENDVEFATMPGNGKFITIDGKAFGYAFKDSTVFRRLMVTMRDGSVIQLSVDFIEILDDTDTTVIWLNETLPARVFDTSTVDRISWLLLCRFASDRLEVNYETNSVANMTLAITTLENFDL
jgi:hypothetical protein